MAWLSMIAGMSDQALAQGRGWEVEVHGGGAFATNLSGGTTTLPTSTPLPTPLPEFPSRRVSTWFVGAGSGLANDVAGQISRITERITPLDGILSAPLGERGGGGSFGFRVSRVLTPRFSAEFNFDYSATSLDVPSAASSGVQTTATSFRTTFEAFMVGLTTPNTPTSVTSSGSVAGGGGHQILATGAITYNLLTAGKFIPYATGGLGIISEGGDAPSAQLDGQYGVRILTTPWFEETDRVSLTYDADDQVFVGVLGGGVRMQLSPRAGMRGDVRVHLGSRTVRTLLDANPSIRVATPDLATIIGTRTNPSFVMSNNPSLINFSSSLSGPVLDGFEAYTVDGLVTQTLVSVGYFFTF
jgi:hypothetical protein